MFSEEINEFIDTCIVNMDESKRGLTRPVLEQFVWYTIKVRELQEQIDRDGSIIEVERGSANHQYVALAENPAVKVITKYSTQAGGHYSKLMRFLSQAEMEQVDALEDFLKNG